MRILGVVLLLMLATGVAMYSHWMASRVRTTRVAVLHVGQDPAGKEGLPSCEGTLGFDLPLDAYARAADELERLGVEVVVLRFNCGGIAEGELKDSLDLLERSYLKRFRTVSWVVGGLDSSNVMAMAAPELYMASGGGLVASLSVYRSYGTAKAAWEEHLTQIERDALLGGRPIALVRAMQLTTPLSTSVVDGERHLSADLAGGNVLSRGHWKLSLWAEQAAELGVSLGTVDDRAALARAMGLGKVEWVGEEVDRRVQAECAEAMRDIETLVEEGVKALLASRAMLAVDSAERRAAQRRKRDVAWGEVLRLRGKWPDISDNWAGMLATADWRIGRKVEWKDVAERVGVIAAEGR